jgi:hypothetical protein
MSSAAQDWARLQQRYQAMSDEELLELSESSGDLTEVAREALAGELSQRNLSRKALQATLPEEDRWVVVQQVHDLEMALHTRSVLNSLGIETIIDEEERHTLHWFIEHAADGLSVYVRHKDVPDARRAFEDWASAEYEAQQGLAGE